MNHPAESTIPSLRQFSKLAGVSPATVSRVFADSPVVALATRRRIRQLAQSVGFRPSAVANAAFGGKTRSVGVLLPVLDVSYFADIASGIQQRLLEDDYLPLLLEFLHGSTEEQTIHRLIDHRPDALILSIVNEALSRDDLLEVLRTRIPMVLLGPVHPNLATDTVDNDNVAGGRLAGQHLCELGHRRFGCCYFGAGNSAADQRLAGFQQALMSCGGLLAPHHIIRLSPYDRAGVGMEKFEAELEQLLRSPQRPTAIFAAMDPLAAPVYRVARRLGLVIPRDLSIVGFANLNYTDLIDPPLTTIDQNGREVGKRAAEIVLNRLNNPDSVLQSVSVGVRLIQRQSTAPSPNLTG